MVSNTGLIQHILAKIPNTFKFEVMLIFMVILSFIIGCATGYIFGRLTGLEEIRNNLEEEIEDLKCQIKEIDKIQS